MKKGFVILEPRDFGTDIFKSKIERKLSKINIFYPPNLSKGAKLIINKSKIRNHLRILLYGNK